MRKALKIAGVAVALAATFGAGMAAGSARPATAETATPASCLKYIDLSEQLIDYTVDALGEASSSMMAVARLDADAIDESTARVNALTPKIEALTSPVQTAKKDCRGGK